MSYDTDHDFDWVFAALRPRGQVPGMPEQTLPHKVLDAARPVFDAMGWSRYDDEDVIGTINVAALNAVVVNGPVTPEGVIRFYWAAAVIHEAAVNQAVWLESVDNRIGLISCGISPTVINVPQNVGTSILRPTLVRPGNQLRGRAEPGTAVGENLRIRGFFIDLPVGEYIAPQ